MTRVSCPHCGFLNFSISAVCGRCEGSLREGVAPAPTPAPVARPSHAHRTAHDMAQPRAQQPPAPRPQPPAPVRQVAAAPVVPEEADDDFELEMRPVPTPVRPPGPPALPTQRPVSRRSAREVTPLAAVPPPKPPPAAARAKASVPLPIDVDNPSSAELPAAPRVTGRFEMGGVAQVPAVWRQLAANVVDLAFLLALGAGVSTAVSWLVGNPWPWESVGWFDALASWMAADSLPAWVGVAVVVLAGPIYGLLTERFGLRTVGRFLTGLTLVRTNGLPLPPWRLRARAALSLLSGVPLGAGFLFAIVSPRGATIHDHLCGTAVLQPMRKRTRVTRRTPRAAPQQLRASA